MNHPFGWSLPPGVSLSDLGGPNDPTTLEAEEITERLGEAFYRATRAGFTVEDIRREWAASAEEAHADDLEDAAREEAWLKEVEELAETVRDDQSSLMDDSAAAEDSIDRHMGNGDRD